MEPPTAPQTAPLAPKVQVFWPCAKCNGTGVAMDTGHRCPSCANHVGWSKKEHITIAAFKQLLRASS
jgi:DnaJ-class molecular chaperone